MKPQRRAAFNSECGYLKPHGTHDPRAAAATGDAMRAFLEKGGKVTRLDPVKVDEAPAFKASIRSGFVTRRGKK